MVYMLDRYKLPQPENGSQELAQNLALEKYGINLDLCDDVTRDVITDFMLNGASAALMNLIQNEQEKQLNLITEP